jgi:hypothetical protein
MARHTSATLVAAAIACVFPYPARAAAVDRPGLEGRWTLSRSLSEFPEVGFGADLLSEVGRDAAGGGGSWNGSDRSGGGGQSAAPDSRMESEDDVRRAEQLTDEVRNPSAHLMIAETATAVTITDDRGRSRTFHPDGRDEAQQLDRVPVGTRTRWEGPRLVVRYAAEQNRELRYTYSRRLAPPQLVVEIEFIERGGRQRVTRVYEPSQPDEPPTPVQVAPAIPAKPAAPAAARSSAGQSPKSPIGNPAPDRAGAPVAPPAQSSAGQSPKSPIGNPAPDRTGTPVVPQGRDAELKGLTSLGVVVEDQSSQAAGCGLSESAIDAAVSQSLTAAGLKVLHNTDEDTYLYVDVMSTSVSPGLCVSKYDVYLYTHVMATLSYQTAPVLVQVSLLHEGGITGGAPATHASAVTGTVRKYVDEFASRIRNANR